MVWLLMRLAGIVIVLLTFLASSATAGKKLPSQMLFRDLGHYRGLLSQEFIAVLAQGRTDPAFVWLDYGAGSAFAQVMSYYDDQMEAVSAGSTPSREAEAASATACHQSYAITLHDVAAALAGDLDADDTALWRRFKAVQTGNGGNLTYLAGRKAEEYKAGELPRASLITDVFGPLSYAESKFGLLRRYVEQLSDTGVGYIVIPNKLRVLEKNIPEGEELGSQPAYMAATPLAAFLQKQKIPGFEVFYGVDEQGARYPILRITRSQAALDHLEALERAVVGRGQMGTGEAGVPSTVLHMPKPPKPLGNQSWFSWPKN